MTPDESADADPGDEHRVQWYCTGGIPRWGWTFWARQGDVDPFRDERWQALPVQSVAVLDTAR